MNAPLTPPRRGTERKADERLLPYRNGWGWVGSRRVSTPFFARLGAVSPLPGRAQFPQRDGAATKPRKNIQHRTSNAELRTWRTAISRWRLNVGTSKFKVRCLDVR